MLLPNMTYTELRNEFDGDYEESVKPRLLHILEDNRYRRFCLKLQSDQFHAFKPIELTSKKGNHCTIYLSTYGKSDFRITQSVHSQTLMKIQGTRGVNYMTRADTTNGVYHCIFSHHLFERYAERRWGRKDANIKDVMVDVITQLNHILQKPINDARYPNGFFCLSTLGVFLGESVPEDKFVIYKTFVSFDLLHSSQNDICDELTPLLEWMDKEMPNDIL